MNVSVLLTLVGLSATCFCACEKSDDCPPNTNVVVSANYTSITQGWDLNLSANYSSLFTYAWTGPTGWSTQANSAVVTRTNMQFQDAGTYYVKVYNSKNCEVYSGSQVITVAPVQDAPCQGSLSGNTCITDISGLSSFNVSPVYFANNPINNSSTVSCYTSSPTPANTYMTVTFTGKNKPRPGIYKTVYGFNAFGKEDELSINLYHGGSAIWYVAAQGQMVYVTTVSGKTQICICNIRVSDGPSGPAQYLSGKMTIGN